jgi:hypothetical protein
MDPTQGSYDASGQLVCRTCSANRAAASASATIVATDPSSNRNLYGAAAASSLLGLVTCCLAGLGPFFFVACPLSVLLGGGTMVNLLRRPDARQALGGGYWLVIAGAVGGVVFGGLGTLLGLLGMVGMGMRH